jgi:hypothetical protein
MIWLIALLILVGVLAYGRASLRWTTLVLFGWLGLYSMAKGGGNFVFCYGLFSMLFLSRSMFRLSAKDYSAA